MKQVIVALTFVLLLSLTGCGSDRSDATRPPDPISTPLAQSVLPTPTSAPTQPPVTALPSPVPLTGEWRRFTTADGLCTDSPVFIGPGHIGTGTTTICAIPDLIDGLDWRTMTVPQGTRVTAALNFSPGGTLGVATDAGICYDMAWMRCEKPCGQVWECQGQEQGFPYRDIRGMLDLNSEPVYMLTDTIVCDGQLYDIPQILGEQDARPTLMAISGGFSSSPMIWIVTNGYGLLTIRVKTGEVTQHSVSTGLPSNEIRDIDTSGDRGFDDYSLWAATDQGIGYWGGEQWIAYTTTDGLPSNDVRSVSSGGSRSKNVWVATAGGPAYFNGQAWQAVSLPGGLPAGALTGVSAWGVHDGQQSVWFSTLESGLLLFLAELSAP